MTKLYAVYLFKVVWLEFPYIPSLRKCSCRVLVFHILWTQFSFVMEK